MSLRLAANVQRVSR